MNLVEANTIPVFELPLAQLRDQLRVASGFADDAVQDGVLEAVLRAALAAVEARTGKALLSRGFRWTVNAWRAPEAQALPIAPVTELTGFKFIGRNGDETPIDLDWVQLVQDAQRPMLRANGASLPKIPVGGVAEIGFTAGFALNWEGLPGDLQLAVLVLAAYFYEHRGDGAMEDGNMPLPVAVLTERYRTVRILGGGV